MCVMGKEKGERKEEEKVHLAIFLDRHIKLLSSFFLSKVGEIVLRSYAGQLHHLLYCLH